MNNFEFTKMLGIEFIVVFIILGLFLYFYEVNEIALKVIAAFGGSFLICIFSAITTRGYLVGEKC